MLRKCLICKQHMQLKLLINTAPTATRHVPSLGVGGMSKLLPYGAHTAIKRRSISFNDAAEPRKENRTWPASQTSRPTVTAQSNGSFLHTLHHFNVTKYNILFLLQLRAEDTEPHILKQGNLDQGWLQANHLPEPSWLGKAFLDGPVWLSAHGHPAMSCSFSIPKEVVFSEQRHLGEKQICQEAELPTTHSLWRHEEKEGIKDCWAQWLPRRVWARRDQHRWLIYEQQGDQGDTPEMQSLICQHFQNSSEAAYTNFFEKNMLPRAQRKAKNGLPVSWLS